MEFQFKQAVLLGSKNKGNQIRYEVGNHEVSDKYFSDPTFLLFKKAGLIVEKGAAEKAVSSLSSSNRDQILQEKLLGRSPPPDEARAEEEWEPKAEPPKAGKKSKK